MEQLVAVINNGYERAIYATAPNVDATGLDQADYLTVRVKGGKLRRLAKKDITQWWEKDMKDGSLLVLEKEVRPYFEAEPCKDMKKLFVSMQRDADGRIQPLREFECKPTVESIENMQEEDQDDTRKLLKLDDYGHVHKFSADYYVCWTDKDDYEAALPETRKDKYGRESMKTSEIDTSNAIFLDPDDFQYLNEKKKIYAYIHKTEDICAPETSKEGR